jgi:hypothetical protein
MRCAKCQYALWNIESRLCPECGSGFTPSEFRFAPDSVKFCCPHCRQAYYGTDSDGLIQPRAFDCARCHKPITLDQMIVSPADGVDEDDTRGPIVPWIERRSIGRPMALLRTMLDSMLRPIRLASSMPKNPPLRDAITFAAGTCLVYGFQSLVIPILIVTLGALAAIPVVGNNPKNPIVLLFFIPPVGLVLAAVFIAAVFAGWAALAHGLLRLTGKTRGGFTTTLQAFCYGHGAHALVGLPCVGLQLMPIAWVWWGLSSLFLLMGTQRVSGSRAFLAVFAAPVLIIGATAAGIFGWLVPSVRSMSSTSALVMGNPMLAAAVGTSAALRQGLRAYRDRENDWPVHPLQLVVSSDVSASDLFVTPKRTALPVAAFDLLTFSKETAEGKQRIRTAVEPILINEGSDLIAIRIGDTVFTYFGLADPTTGGNPDLWALVQIPPLPLTKTSTTAQPVQIGAMVIEATPDAPTSQAAPPASPAGAAATPPATPGEPDASAPVDPASAPNAAADTELNQVIIRTINGTEVFIKRVQFVDALRAQNRLRAVAGLPALEDLLTLPADRPQRRKPTDPAASPPAAPPVEPPAGAGG